MTCFSTTTSVYKKKMYISIGLYSNTIILYVYRPHQKIWCINRLKTAFSNFRRLQVMGV